MCAIYARVSTDNKGQSTENQIPSLQAFADRRGWPVRCVYQEEETAWKAGHQKELSRAKEDGRRGKFDILLVWALDRLSREGALPTLQVYHQFAGYKVQVISLQEPWTEVGGQLLDVLLALAGWVANMESNRRSERTRAGLARVKASGKHIGRPKGKKDGNPRRRRTVTR